MATCWRSVFVNFDLSVENVPIGQKLVLGSDNNVILEVSDIPHNGCKKFMSRFGKDAQFFVNGKERKLLRLRGVNAKFIKSGKIHIQDAIKKID